MKLKQYIAILMLGAAGLVTQANTYRLEAEALTKPEQWQVADTRNASGGKMLASSVKNSSNTAHGEFNLPERGKYHVWVRSQSYGQEHRKYQIAIDKHELGSFGDERLSSGTVIPGFVFNKASEPVELDQGKHVVVLRPDSKYARCDAIILTTDAAYEPPSEPEELAKITPLTSDANASSTSGNVADGQGPQILLLHGARPWIAKETASTLRSAGCKVTCVDSKLLAGLGGASIKTFLSDKAEPAPQDGITPEFARMNNYKVVVIMAIKPEDQQKMFTPERLRQLEEYVKNGGNLLLLENTPSELNNLNAVKLGDFASSVNELQIKRPESKNFILTPDIWPYLGKNRQTTKYPETKVIASLMDKNNRETGIFAALRQIGKGKVGYLNTEITPGAQLLQFRNWAYFGAVMTGMLEELSGENGIIPGKTIKTRFSQPEIATIDKLKLELKLPEQLEHHEFAPAKVTANATELTVKFANKTELIFNLKDMSVKASIAANAFLKLNAPKLLHPASAINLDKSSSEAVKIGGGIARVMEAKWSMTQHEEVKGGGVTLTLKAGKNELNWTFMPVSLNLAGRTYYGFTDNVNIIKASGIVESIQCEEEVRLGSDLSGHRGWRMACYGKPRGFAEIDFSTGKKATTGLWEFFCSGQPFNWLFSPAGIFCEFVDYPIPAYTEQMVNENSSFVKTVNSILLGKPAYPVKVPAWWHIFSSGNPELPNDWMAMYQFQRTRLCHQAGVPQAQPLPLANFQNTCSPTEIAKSLAAAKKLGFVQQSLPWAVSANESMLTQKRAKLLQQTLAAGLRPKPWTASNYAMGMDDPVADKHRDWLVYQPDGKPLMDFGKHPVFDFNNQAYRKYYFDLIDKCISNGLRDIYMDMAGAHAEVINHAKPNYSTGLNGLIEVFKYLRSKGIAVAIEGQNPLVLDGFWYRQRLYTDMTDKEYAFVGMVPGTHNPGDELVFDYFRLAMFNAFPYYNVDGYANGFERTPGEIKQIAETGKLNPMFNAAIAQVGIPFVKQEKCGSSWMSKRGGAVFVWNPVKELLLSLPEGWEIENVLTVDGQKVKYSGNQISEIQQKSIVLLKKK